MKQSSERFLENAHDAMGNPERAAALDQLGRTMPRLRSGATTAFGDFDALRKQVDAVRTHTLDNLDHYLNLFVEGARANGSHVHFARTGEELNRQVEAICQQHGARQIVKGKSMVTEESALNEHLQQAGFEVLETDLGEYIIQRAGETPSHIVAPALHKPIAEIRELFLSEHGLGERDLETAADLVAEARSVLRRGFQAADVGIIGANALVAENGYTALVTNEGNGDLCANLPRVLITCTTIERVLPRMQDAAAMLRLLARSTTGQPITCYTSFYGGPRREEEDDGPTESHIILLDNRRSELLAGNYRDMLKCIRCGACLNHCPVYIAAGGHAYGWVYPGPMGSILTPLLTSLPDSHLLPNACTGCGRCAEVCPANIPLPDLLRDLRHEETRAALSPLRWRLGIRLHARLLRYPRAYRRLVELAVKLLRLFARGRGSLRWLPFASGWTCERDFPAPQGETFMTQYRRRMRRR